jgi:hypothetical protein
MTTNNRRALAFVAALGGVAALAPAYGSIARAVSFEQKVQEADEIVVGRCVKTKSTFDPSGRWIVTYSTFEVEDQLKGNPSHEVTVMTPGGTVGSIRQETVGIPQFREGEEKLIFTASIAGDERTVLYADQGTYDVVGSGENRRIAPVASNLVLIDPKSGAIHAQREPDRPLREFRTSVRQVLNREDNSNPNQMSMTTRATPEKLAELDFKARALRFLQENKILVGMLSVGVALSTIALIRRR